MNNFSFWKDEIADMPEKDSKGNWYDLETGLEFDPSVHYQTGGKATRWEASSDLKDFRKVAKFYGGKALAGSAKQKEWAEKLRYKVLTSDSLSDEQKAEFIALEGATKTAKFWIENKDIPARDYIAASLLKEDSETTTLIDENESGLWSNYVSEIESAKIAIYEKLKSNKFKVVYSFRRSDELYECGELKNLRVNNGRLIRA